MPSTRLVFEYSEMPHEIAEAYQRCINDIYEEAENFPEFTSFDMTLTFEDFDNVVQSEAYEEVRIWIISQIKNHDAINKDWVLIRED